MQTPLIVTRGAAPAGDQPGQTGVWRIIRRLSVTGMLVLGTVLASCGGGSSSDGDSALEIEGQPIAYSEFQSYLQRQLGSEELTLGGVVESRLFDQFINELLVIRLARERGLVGGPASLDEREAVSFLLRDQRSAMLGDERLRAFYEEHRQRYERPAEVWLCQILVDDRQVAERAYRALQAGEPFAEVAARFSQGPKAQHEGDQGRLSQADLPPEFVDVIFNLEPGEFSEVVVADYGMHIFQVKEIYPAEVQPFETVVDDIRQELLRHQADEVVAGFFAEARKRYNVQVFSLNLPFDYQGSFTYATQDIP